MSSKHILLTQVLRGTGIGSLLTMLPTRPGLLVLNYHRIGDASACEFDRAVIAASAEQLDQHICSLKQYARVVGLSEALHLLQNPAEMRQPYVLLTFDDGYLDNYELAFPVLRAHGCSAVFFVVPQFVGTAAVPWWDEISFLVRNCRRSRVEMPAPLHFTIDLGPDRELAIKTTLTFFKSAENPDPETFLQSLREQAEVHIPPQPRRFMNWDEVRELAHHGINIGSHTFSHPILSRLTADQQLHELVKSKTEIEAHTGTRARVLAYPLGSYSAFTSTTRRLAVEAGYEAAFSFFGGINSPFNCELTNVRRMSPWTSADSRVFNTEINLLTHVGPILSKLADHQSAWRKW